MDDRDTALLICGIALLASLVLAPIAAHMFSKLPTDTSTSGITLTEDTCASKNQRQHIRYPLTCTATFSNEHLNGFGMIRDVSQNGCRLKTKLSLTSGDSGKVLIDVPSSARALQVATGVVRWVAGSECGIEFTVIGPAEQRFLQRMIEMTIKVRMADAKEMAAILRKTIPMLRNR
jgi:hypothetical protein